MNKAVLIGVTGLAAALAGCGIAKGKEDAGPTTERDFQVGNFNQIELAGGYDVNVRTGPAPSVHAKGGQNVLDKLASAARSTEGKTRATARSGSGRRGSSRTRATTCSYRGRQRP